MFIAKTNAAIGWIDLQNDRVDAFANFEQIAGFADFLVPGKFREVNQAIDAGQQFDKSAEIGEARDGAGSRDHPL